MSGFAPLLAFDIETVPDIDALRTLHGLPADIGEAEVHDFACRLRRQQGQPDFLPLSLHQVAVISCAILDDSDTGFRLLSLEAAKDGEAKAVERFFNGIDRLTPRLLSWNGKGFDMPVLHYRALIHGVVAERYWESGEKDKSFKWDNYLSRYHPRHLDLMDELSMRQLRGAAKLDVLARQCGLPGKMGMDGGGVWNAWRRKEYGDIRFYCETDAVNTLLLGIRHERMRGSFTDAVAERKMRMVVRQLSKQPDPRWKDYLAALSDQFPEESRPPQGESRQPSGVRPAT